MNALVPQQVGGMLQLRGGSAFRSDRAPAGGIGFGVVFLCCRGAIEPGRLRSSAGGHSRDQDVSGGCQGSVDVSKGDAHHPVPGRRIRPRVVWFGEPLNRDDRGCRSVGLVHHGTARAASVGHRMNFDGFDRE